MNRAVSRALCFTGATVFCAVLLQEAVVARVNGGTATQARNESTRKSTNPYTDETSIRTAAETSMSQVDLAKLAEQKAQNPEVKKFAQQIADEHEKIVEQLKQLASTEHINLPTNVSSKDAATHRQLAKEGAGFDKSYTQQVASELAKQIGEFEHGASATNKPALKEFYERTKPTLEAELQEARRLAAQSGAHSR